MALARFRFEYEFIEHPTTYGQKRWFLYHDAVLFDAEVFSLDEADRLGIGRDMPGWIGLQLLFKTTLDRVVLCPWAPARKHPDVDRDLMACIAARESTLLVTYPNGRHWLHFPDDAI